MAGPVTIGASVNVIDVSALLAKLSKQVENLRPWFASLDTQISQLFREQFETRGARLGTRWAPISEATQEIRIVRRMLSARARAKARGAPGKDTPLRDTGGLYAAFTKPGAPGSVRIIDNLSYMRGADYSPDGVPVALLMQEGFRSVMRPIITKAGDVIFRRRLVPKRVPARPIVPQEMPAPILRAWEGQLVAYIESGAL